MKKNLFFDMDDDTDRMNFALLLACLNKSGVVYSLRKNIHDSLVTIEIGEGY